MNPVQWAQNLVKSGFVVLDTETSGFRSTDEILQIGIVNQDGEALVDSYVCPFNDIDEDGEVFGVHGISKALVSDAPDWSVIWPTVKPVLTRAPVIVAYNAEFDSRMIRQDCDRHGIEGLDRSWDCAMNQFKAYTGRRHKLEAACAMMGVEAVKWHGAAADAYATVQLIRKLAEA